MRWEGYTINDDYLSISFEGMRETKREINRSIEDAKEQRENISRAIESLQVPDSVLRGYGDELIPVKNSIGKEIEELQRMNLHIDYVMRRFEEVDNEFAARFRAAGYEIRETIGLGRESGIFGGCIAGLTPIVSQVTKAFSGVNNKLEKKAAQLTYSSLYNNTGKSLLLTGNGNITAQAEKMYLSQKSSFATNYSVKKATKGEDSKLNVYSESQLRSLEELLNNSGTPYYVKDIIKKSITDAGAMYFIDPKTGDYVVKNKESDGTVYCHASADGDTNITKANMEANAKYIYDYFTKLGWSKEAICALLGNMQRETGAINPGRWEVKNLKTADSHGYGLVQWTPASSKFLKWAGLTHNDADKMANNDPKKLMDKQLEFLLINLKLKPDASKEDKQNYGGEWGNNQKRLNTENSYGLSVDNLQNMKVNEFIYSDMSPGDLALVFEAQFERSGDTVYNKDGSINKKGIAALQERIDNANYWYDLFSK